MLEILEHLPYVTMLFSLFFQTSSYRKIRSGIPSWSISLDTDQICCFVWLDLSPNCLQRLSAEDTKQAKMCKG